MTTRTCKTCDLCLKAICLAPSTAKVDPRGDCPTWAPREMPDSPRCPEHAAIVEALTILLRSYPELWFQQADAIAKVLQATKAADPKWPQLANSVWALRKWVNPGQRRAFRAACAKAGAITVDRKVSAA